MLFWDVVFNTRDRKILRPSKIILFSSTRLPFYNLCKQRRHAGVLVFSVLVLVFSD